MLFQIYIEIPKKEQNVYCFSFIINFSIIMRYQSIILIHFTILRIHCKIFGHRLLKIITFLLVWNNLRELILIHIFLRLLKCNSLQSY